MKRLILLLCSVALPLAAQNVHIPDPALDASIRHAIGWPPDVPIPAREMLRLTHLNADAKGIIELTGLEHATNLIGIIMNGNEIHDLSPLAGLTQLTLLMFHNNLIQDLSPVANLTQLTYLGVIGCPVADLRPLARLTRLEQFDAHDCDITDISPLTNLTQLHTLHLANNRIADVSPLANLTALQTLYLEGNQIVDVSPLANLINLETLWIHRNWYGDMSMLSGMAISDFQMDEECYMPGLTIHDRIANRSMPSVCTMWGNEIITKEPMPHMDRLALHDLHVEPVFVNLGFRNTPDGYKLIGHIESTEELVEERRSRNPNTLLFANIRQHDAPIQEEASNAIGEIDGYPEDWPYWVKDEYGNPVGEHGYLIDIRLPGAQDIIVEQAIAVSECGLYDGIFFDWWSEVGSTMIVFGPPFVAYSTEAEEREARLNILRRIRANVPDDFLIIGNGTRRKYPLFASYMNGNFMELRYDPDTIGYTREGIIEIETNLIWLERNMREPQVNCLQGIGIYTEPPDSPRNLQYMRLFTTMSLTCSDGYVVYTLGGAYTDTAQDLDHLWYDFWDADLGHAITPIAQNYREINGVYIREFTNGWAVYNRSGEAHVITLPEQAQGVASGLVNMEHALPDLDGEIYLRVKPKNAADVNRDGVVNILDLTLVARALDTDSGREDVNRDGVVNVMDLVFIANQF